MSLVVGIQSKWIPWPEVGAEILIAPLSPAKKYQFESECRVLERDAQGNVVSARRDVPKYQQLVGRECVKGWRGMERPDGARGPGLVTAGGAALPYSPEACDAVMTIEPAADFVILHAQGLAIHLQEETAAAGKG